MSSVIVKRLDYDSPELSILRRWMYGESWKDAPVESITQIKIKMRKSKDVQLLKNLEPFSLPSF
jgi:hypothetical protein